MKNIKFMPDYGSACFWDLDDEGCAIDVEDLNLSTELAERISKWMKIFDTTIDSVITGGKPCFNDPDTESIFNKEGRSIFLCLRDELSDCNLFYRNPVNNESVN